MSKSLVVFFLNYLLFSTLQGQITYNLGVEQFVDGSELVLDFFVERPVGSTPFAFGSSNFSVFLNNSALNLAGRYKDAAFDGPWDASSNPTNYFELGVNHGSNFVVMNIMYKVGSPGGGTIVPEGRTRIGRMRIPILDPTQCNSLTWRIIPVAISAHDGSDLKPYANFVPNTYCLPLCANPPIFTYATDKVCTGTSYFFETQNASTAIVIDSLNAEASITTLDTATHLFHFTGDGWVKVRFTGQNGCTNDTIITVHNLPSIAQSSIQCTTDSLLWIGSSPNIAWTLVSLDTTLQISDTVGLGDTFGTAWSGFGNALLVLSDTLTGCMWDTTISLYETMLTPTYPYITCENAPFSISIQPQPLQVVWNMPSGVQVLQGGGSQDSFLTGIASMTGVYDFMIYAQNPNGCWDTLQYQVQVEDSIGQFTLMLSQDSSANAILISPVEPVWWYYNDTLLTNTNDTLTGLNEGYYLAVYLNSCGTFTSDTFFYQLNSEQGIQSSISCTWYPNPTRGELFLQMDKAGDYRVWVYNTTGQRIREEKFSADKHVISFQGMSDGVYYVEIEGLCKQKILYYKR